MKAKDIKKLLVNKFDSDKVSVTLSRPEDDIKTLLTDSRNFFTPGDTIFFAIKTEGGNDGHKFIKDVYEKGVRNFVVETIPPDLDIAYCNIFLVPDTIEALWEIGRSKSRNSKEIVAITGSRGKTTIKEIIFQLLENDRKISRSPRSYNSRIGVPLSLWQISPETDIALIEAGISKKGEMSPLAGVIDPDTVILTNIGDAHAQGFASKEEKAYEKCMLASGDNVKTIIYPKDSELLDHAIKLIKGKKQIINWSAKDSSSDLFLRVSEDGIEYTWKGETGSLPVRLFKEYDLENIAGALAFLLKEGFSFKEIKKRFETYHSIDTRLNITEGVNGCSIIKDSYTSDLSSLLPAIDFMKRRKMPEQSLTLIMSPLLHEGINLDETYKEVAIIIRNTGISKFIGIGEPFEKYKTLFPEGSKFYYDTVSFLKDFTPSDFIDEIILMKGSINSGFENIRQHLEARKHETVLEVNLDALLRNYNYFRSQVPSSTGIIAMVKASGYGAGSYEIAKTLQDAGAAYLAVAALDEGVDLRSNGITMPIMVMNPRAVNYKALFNNRLEPVVYNMNMLEILSRESVKYGVGSYPVHIKLDTGMHRMGFEEKDLEELSRIITLSENIKVASIFSHLATADCMDMDNYTYLQLNRFEKMSSRIISALGYDVRRHVLNSAGIIRFPEYHYDMVRLGIGLYGVNTLPPEVEKTLSPVTSLRTVIISIREIEGDEAVGYSRKGRITGKTRIATLPIGYADGMNRKFGNGNIKVMVNGKKAPTIGNICMDATMINVTGIDCEEGDSVEIFGEKINVSTLAETLDTIPYEVLTSISPRVKRIYFRE